ncbi:GerAB/ArcD/ProY family transporter [Bacillus sp. FJAT-29814]|uniref:GerAB/ArcD/ProY family transporter n=1 Tax=Bacillus sp. FJAT-29814 TaxID=1729688 RepID=UPI00082994C8|nr:GerAB/ArcD/ProY family transporter [Bacillus sp. FJAT-29814]
MKQKPVKLGIREYVAIAILMAGARATEDTPANLYQKVENAAWMVPLLSSALFFIPLYLLLKTMSLFQGKNMFVVMNKLLGKYVGFTVGLIIFVISSSAISFDSRTYTNIIRTYYFNTTPVLVLYAILIAICAYGAKKGIQHVGSASVLIVFWVICSLAFALLLSIQDSTLQSVLPILGPGILEIIKTTPSSLAIFADFFLLTMLVPYFKSNKEFQKGTWIAYVFVSVQISASVFFIICFFDQSLGGLGYPFHTLIRYISLGTYIPNIEIFFFAIWIMGAIIRFTAFLYLTALIFGQLFKIKDFEYLIPSIATIYLLIGLIPESPVETIVHLKSSIRALAGPMFAAISLILWLAALAKGEFKRAKNKNSM